MPCDLDVLLLTPQVQPHQRCVCLERITQCARSFIAHPAGCKCVCCGSSLVFSAFHWLTLQPQFCQCCVCLERTTKCSCSFITNPVTCQPSRVMMLRCVFLRPCCLLTSHVQRGQCCVERECISQFPHSFIGPVDYQPLLVSLCLSWFLPCASLWPYGSRPALSALCLS